MKFGKQAVENNRFRLMASAGVAALALAAAPAFAQDAGQDEGGDSSTSEEPEAQAPAAPQGIVVTGSRIRRDEFSSPSPITVIDPRESAKQGLIDTADMIQGSPVAAGSDQITAALSSNFVTNGGSGSQTISLRGLGPERTLVLLNGRRAGPAGTRGAVSAFDLNVLPQQIMQRVDILKDGASSIYGSDAVAGVVNLITKTETDGIELNLFGSVPFESGGEQIAASATWGKTFDRGHVLVAGNYYKQKELARGDRDYLGCPEAYFFTDLSFSTRADLVDPRTGEFRCQGDSTTTWGHVWTYDYSYYYSANGSNIPGSLGVGDVSLIQYSYPGDNLGQFIPGVSAPTDSGQISIPAGWFPVSYDPASQAVTNSYHPLMNNDSVIPKTERWTVYLDAAYELTDSIEAYTELLFNRRENYINGSRQIWQFGFGETLGGLFGLDDSNGDPLANGFGGPALFSPTGFTDNFDSSVRVDYFRAVAGLRGDISSNWTWDLYGQYSKSDGTYRNQQTLADSIAAGDFRGSAFGDAPSPCAGSGYVTPIGGKQCVDVDWYSPRVMFGDLTPEEEAFLFDWDKGNTEYTQQYAEAIISGDTSGFFELPGGPIGIAIGGTIRQDKINDTPGDIILADNAWQVTASGITAGKARYLEAFGEISLPLLADIPFIQNLELTAAGRVTNVKATRASDGASDTDNGNWTYKLGLNWEVNDWLRFRGTYGTSYRAPALFESFLADQTSALSQRTIDPCIQWGNNLAQGNISQSFADNCAADGVPANHTGAGISATIITGGGLGVLEPETSDAWTVSAVLTPNFNFLPDTDISLAVDYFNIEVNGQIAQLGARNILSQCYASDFFPNDPVCSLFRRNDDTDEDGSTGGSPSNVFDIRDSFININSQKNEGVDVTFRLRHDFGDDWIFTAQAVMTWQTLDSISLFSGFEEDLNGEVGEPEWVGDFRFNLDKGPWNFFYSVDVVGGADSRPDWFEATFGRDWKEQLSSGAITQADLDDALCPQFTTFNGPTCLDFTVGATFYHAASITREINENFSITAGMTNIFDTRPPLTSQTGGDNIRQFGAGVFTSQYDLIGRRAFINVNVKY
jgi:iron complex outermembrane receptor protein